MSPKIDPAILSALSIDPSTAQIVSHGSSGFSGTYKITTPTTSLFIKTSTSPGASVMFEGEHASLNAINAAVPSLCPKSFAWGKLENGGYFLATEFLELGNAAQRTKTSGSGMTLAQKLAKLHCVPAPTPNGYDRPQFGFPVTTCCGDTPQTNSYASNWADFFAKNRMLAILERAEKNNGRDAELRRLIEQTANKVVPRLLGEGHLGGSEGIVPVVTHGDLWSGNKGKGLIVGRGQDSSDHAGALEDLLFDPSCAYAHSEYDHGIMNMFGGFNSAFWKEYFEILPKTEPVDEYRDRVNLYESYHHLNHYAMFGGSYKGGALALLQPLVRKYGG